MPREQKTYDVHGVGVEQGFGEGIDPTGWRDEPDPDLQHATEEQIDNDEDAPTPDCVKMMLGFDPDLEESIEDSE